MARYIRGHPGSQRGIEEGAAGKSVERFGFVVCRAAPISGSVEAMTRAEAEEVLQDRNRDLLGSRQAPSVPISAGSSAASVYSPSSPPLSLFSQIVKQLNDSSRRKVSIVL